MSLTRPKTRLRHRLFFRLTVWYAAILALAAAIVFFFSWLLIGQTLERQIDQELAAQADGIQSLFSARGIDTVARAMLLQTRAAGERRLFFRLFSSGGQEFFSSNLAFWPDIRIRPEAVRRLVTDGRPVWITERSGGSMSAVRVLYAVVGPGVFLQVGRAMEAMGPLLEAFGKKFFFTTGLLLLVASLAGGLMAKKALSGVGAVTLEARLISQGGDLGRRVPVSGRGDEIDLLSDTFNRMLDRIEALIRGIRQMGEDIAHDLKSPLTRIRGLAEVTLTTRPGLEAYERMAAETIEACDGLMDMIHTMLTISKTEAGVEGMNLEAVDLTRLVVDACELFEPMAEDKGIRLSCRTGGEPVAFQGDLGKLQRMVANLLDNAIKYTSEGGAVQVAFTRSADGRMAEIRVSDTGPGIDPGETERVFERFYRGDRSRCTPGAGLGLSLARAVARAHDGGIRLESQPGEGSVFTVELPLSPRKEGISIIT